MGWAATHRFQPVKTPLPLITAMARSGALDRAWALFEGAGYDLAVGDPAALAVKGRLLKDRGLAAKGAERLRWLGDAARAYADADALASAPYLRINVATLTYLSGRKAKGAELAQSVIDQISSGDTHAETPYWLAATRAEAMVLRGDIAGADRAFTEARLHSPESWSDHASTLRQLKMIADFGAMPTEWMDRHRPPKSIHFAGHMGVSFDDAPKLRAKIDDMLEAENVGFGFGALAAGADIIIAEALLSRGAELNVVLPVGRAAYFAQSVDPYGAAWRDRFEACLNAATTVQEATQIGGQFEPLAVALSGDYSMGAAVLNARMLESSATQIIIADEGEGRFGTGKYTARDAERWRNTGHAQHVLRARRAVTVPASATKGSEVALPTRHLLALLHARIHGAEQLADADWPRVQTQIMAPLRTALDDLAASPLSMRQWNAQFDLAFDDLLPSFDAARALITHFSHLDLDALGLPSSLALTVTGHFAIGHAVAGDAQRETQIVGGEVRLPSEIALQAHPGSFTVSSTYANALAFQTSPDIVAEYVGDFERRGVAHTMPLYAVRER